MKAQSQMEESLDNFSTDVDSLMQDLSELKKEIAGDSENIMPDFMDNKTEAEVFEKFR